MKKLLCLLLIGSALFAFSSCHEDGKIDHPDSGTYHETKTAEKMPDGKTKDKVDDWDENTGTLDLLPGTAPGTKEGGLPGAIDELPGADGAPSGGAPSEGTNPGLSGEPGANG